MHLNSYLKEILYCYMYTLLHIVTCYITLLRVILFIFLKYPLSLEYFYLQPENRGKYTASRSKKPNSAFYHGVKHVGHALAGAFS